MGKYNDNPAGWLLTNLEYLLAEGRQQQAAKTDITVSLTLKNISQGLIGQKMSKDNDIANYLMGLSGLPVEVREEVYTLRDFLTEAIIDHMLRWYPNAILALSILLSPSAKFSTFITRIKPDALTALEECSELLHIHRPKATLEQGELMRLRGLLDELLHVLEDDATIDRDLRNLLLRHARAMDTALINASAMGVPVVEEALAETIGSLYLNWQLVAHWDTNPNTWQKVTAVLSAIAASLSLGTAAIQALEPHPPTSPPAIENVIVVRPPGSAHLSGESRDGGTPENVLREHG